MNTALPQKFWAARIRFRVYFPYMYGLLLKTVPVPSEEVPTMAVDQWWRMYVNPKWVESLTVEQVTWALMHECNHLFRNHHKRAATAKLDNELWNIAGDLGINDDLEFLDGIRTPRKVLMPTTFGLPDGLLEEVYYDRIRQLAQPGQSGGSSQQNKSSGGKGTGTRPGGRRQKRDPTPEEIEEFIRRGKQGPGLGRCGSGASGKKEDWELGPPGSPDAPKGVSPEMADIVRSNTARELIDHLSKQPGSIPGGMVRIAADLYDPRVPRQEKFSTSLRTAVELVCGMVDWTYAEPNPLQPPGANYRLPTLVGGLCNVTVGIDTSSSMTKEQLSQALAEIRGIIDALLFQVLLRVMSVDAALQNTQEILDADAVELQGGGGTNMGVVLTEALKQHPLPNVVVVITDGYTDWPTEKPQEIETVIVVILGQEEPRSVDRLLKRRSFTDSPRGPSWADCVYVP